MSTFRLLILSAFLLFSSINAAFAESLVWTPYDKALEKAAEEDKKVYFYFQSRHCRYCKAMEGQTLNNPEVTAYLNAHFVNAIIDVDKDTALAREFQVNGVPNNTFLSANGERLFSRPGYVPAETFLNMLKILNTKTPEK